MALCLQYTGILCRPKNRGNNWQIDRLWEKKLLVAGLVVPPIDQPV